MAIQRSLLIGVACAISATCALAETKQSGSYTWYYEVYDGKAEIINEDFSGAAVSPEPSSGTLLVPPYLGIYPVTSLGAEAFSHCASMTGVSIPSSVTYIGDWAFEGCMSLKSVDIPSKVTEIGQYAFSDCTALKSVKIPDGVTRIGSFAFDSCESLQSVTIPSKLTEIEQSAFYGCKSLASVTIPGTVKVIDVDAFMSCTGVSSLTIKDGVREIYGRAFADCTSLTSVTIPDSVTIIGDSAFQWCESLRSVSLPGHFFGVLDTMEVFSGCHDDLVITYRGATVQTYRVTFGKNGGSGGDSYVTATEGKPMPTPRTAPTLSGWTFAGYWDTLATDEKGNAKGKQYYDGSMKSVRSWDKKSETTLWAKWTNKVTFGKNGGSGGDSYVTCTKGQPMPKRTMPTKSGYFFDGYWNTTGAGGVKYYNSDGTSAHAWDKSGNVTLWAKWVKPVACKVTFGKNGGTGGDSYVTATSGKPMPTPRTAPKLSGWTFAGYWDTLAQDANGNPLGKQYYDANMKSVRNWDKTADVTLWAKWTVRVTLGKNGGTGGDSVVTVTKGQSFPKRTMPTRAGYKFGGYFVSSSKKTGQCYNKDGTGTASMKWSTGGSPTIWALWTRTSGLVETPRFASPAAVAAPAVADPAAIPAGLYSGVLADGSGSFWLKLDEPEEGCDRTAYLYVASEDDAFTAECAAEEADGAVVLAADDGSLFIVDLDAGIASRL